MMRTPSDPRLVMHHTFAAAACSLLSICATQDAAPPASEARLVVLIAVDQLIPEQLERLAAQLDGGLGRLVRAGTRFEAARLDYSMTATGPGHATFSTGCLPRTHGIVGNDMFDRATRAPQYCMHSGSARAVVDAGVLEGYPGRSTENMRARTIAERLKALDPAAQVVSVAGKDRSALAMGGPDADGVYWWDLKAGGFMSSNAYADALPTWVSRGVNAAWLHEASGWTWKRVFDPEAPPPGTQPDERDGETPRADSGVTFPHALPAFPVDEVDAGRRKALATAVFFSPLTDRFVMDLTLDAVTELKLGTDASLDLLAIGLSMCDVVGHGFGPYSHETTDTILRADDLLGELFTLLDEQVGAGRWVAALTADHGVLPLPEHLIAQGHSARRVTGSESAELRRTVSQRLKADFGDNFGLKYALFAFSVDEDEVRAAGHEPAAVRAVIAAEAVKTDWVRAAFTLDELLAPADAADPTNDHLRLFRNSTFPGRTSDVVLMREERTLVALAKGTSHGSAHAYDRRIPLVFYGPGFAAEMRADACGSEDVLPTLFGALGLEVPTDIDGRDLIER